MSVTADDLHFGTAAEDPTGCAECEYCDGRIILTDGTTCPECLARQELRNGWWTSSTGPAHLRAVLRDYLAGDEGPEALR